MLSDFAHSLYLPGLATMDCTHIRHWLTSLHHPGISLLLFPSGVGPLFGFSSGAWPRKNAPHKRRAAPMAPGASAAARPSATPFPTSSSTRSGFPV